MGVEVPRASRLPMPRGYEAAADDEPLLPWSRVVQRLEQAQNYWLATTWPDGRPHVTPIWGVWVDGGFYFDGIPTARWARNLVATPTIAVHLESGDNVVILEGVAEDLDRITDPALAVRIVEQWQTKYGRLLPQPLAQGMFRLRPRTAQAWSLFPHDATRWTFPNR